jgi:hypothetical protein
LPPVARGKPCLMEATASGPRLLIAAWSLRRSAFFIAPPMCLLHPVVLHCAPVAGCLASVCHHHQLPPGALRVPSACLRSGLQHKAAPKWNPSAERCKLLQIGRFRCPIASVAGRSWRIGLHSARPAALPLDRTLHPPAATIIARRCQRLRSCRCLVAWLLKVLLEGLPQE